MSTEIDKRIVEMEFRNQEFEKNAERTRKTLEELEKSLDFDNDVSKSLDVISSKFTTMGMIGQNVLRNLTDSVVDLGKTMVKSLTIDGLMEGFGQYESINSSTKVLMNATGDSLATVTNYLAELQRYAQATVYDFAFMTENITKFVNSGLNLDISVNAMEGLGNAMAYVGVEGAQANQVIYNVSQALSTGFMGLMDWKSLELAGMATKNFKQVLLDTAVEMGTVVKVGEKYQSLTTDLNGKVSDLMDTETMRNELASRWLTNDVLIKALSKYTDESTELGKAAAAAARNITSFSKMIDALTEERSGGWASSFRIIFGDLEEATEMWTSIYTRIEKWMSSVADFRNNILQAWAGFGGRNESVQAFHNMLSIVEGLASPMGKALDKLFAYNKGWRYLDELTDTIDIGPTGNVIYESMVKVSRAFNSFTESLIPSEKTLRSITDILAGVFTIIRDIVSVLTPVVIIIGKVIKIVTPLFKILLAIGGVLGNIILQISNAVREALNLGPAFNNITEFLDHIYDVVNNFADAAVDKIYEIPEKFGEILGNIKNLKFPNLKQLVTGIFDGLTNAINNFKDKRTLSSFFEGFFNTDSIKNLGKNINMIFSDIVTNTKNFVNNLRESLMNLGPVGKFIVSVFDLVLSVVTSAVRYIEALFPSLSETLSKTSSNLADFFSGFNISDAIDMVKIVSFTLTMAKLKSSIVSIGDVAKGVSKVLASVKVGIEKFSETIENVGKGIKMRLQAEAFKNIAYGVGVIVASIIALTAVNPADLENAVVEFAKIVALLGALVLTINTFGSSIDTAFVVASSLGTLAIALGSVSILIAIITSSIQKLGTMDSNILTKGVSSLTDVLNSVGKLASIVALAAVVMGLINKLPTKSGAVENLGAISAGIIATAFSLLALYAPVKLFGEMDTNKFMKGFAALIGILTELTVIFIGLALISKKVPNLADNLVGLSIAVMGLSVSISSLILPIFALGSMKPETVSNGLQALVSVILTLSASLIGIGVALRLMSKNNPSVLKMAGAFALLMTSFAVVSLIAPMIMSNADKVKMAVTKLIDIFVDAIVDSAGKIARGALQLVSDVLLSITAYLPMILIELEIILNQILDWLIVYLPSFSDKIGEALGILITGIARAMKNNVKLDDLLITMTTIVTIIILLKKFASLKDDILKAMPAFVALTLVIASLGVIITELVKNGVEGSSAISAAVSLGILLRSLAYVAKKTPDIAKSFKNIKYGQIVKMTAAVGLIAVTAGVILSALSETDSDPVKMVSYATALSIAFLGISPMITALANLQKHTRGSYNMKPMIGLLTAVGGIAAVLSVALSSMAALPLNPFIVATYAAALSAAFVGISPMILSLAVVQKATSGLRTPSLKPMLGILTAVGGIALAIGGTLALISFTNIDGASLSNSLSSLSETFLAMVPLMTITGLLVALIGKLNIDAGAAAEVGLGISVAIGIIAIIVGGIAALFGAIDLLTEGSFASEIAKGGEIMRSIGEAIGSLIGGLLGGIGGSTLSAFSNTAQPFFEAISALPDNFGEKMQALAVGFLALSTAGFVQAVTDLFGLFTGTSSLTKLGQELANFGPYMKEFSDNFPEMGLDKANSIKLVSESIKSLVDAMPREGGVVQWFTGTANMDGFTRNVGILGEGMKKFAEETVDLDSDSVQHAVYCGKMMAELANTLPKTGGIVQAWGGEVNMEGFSRNLPILGKALVSFNDIVTSDGKTVLNESSVTTAVNAAKMVAGLWDSLPETGGILQDWFGEKDLAGFSKNLPILGIGISDFNDAVTGGNGKSKISQESVAIAIWVGQEIAAIYSTLPESNWFTTFPDLGDFAVNIGLLGKGIRDFSNESNGINQIYVATAVDAIAKMADIQNKITLDKSAWFWEVSADKKRLQNFANNIPLFGKGVKGLSDNMAGADIGRIEAASRAIEALSDTARLANNLAGFSFEVFQRAIENIDPNALSTKVSNMAMSASEQNIAKKFQEIGMNYIQNLYVGMEGNDPESKNALKTSAEKAINQIKEVMLNAVIPSGIDSGPFYRIGGYIVRGVSEGMRNPSAIDSVVQAAGNVVAEALDVMASVAQIQSPSKRAMQIGRYTVEGYGVGLSENVKMVTTPAKMISEEALNAMNEGMRSVYKLIHSGVEFKPTISPVIDLTNARKSASELNTLFSSVDTDSNFGMDNNYSINLTRGVKMEVESSVKATDLTKVTDGISKLGQKLSDMEKAIGDMQIYLDTGALVGNMTVPIMRSMNSQQRKMGRGVIPSRVI